MLLICLSFILRVEMSAQAEPDMVEQKIYRIVQKSGDVIEALFIENAGADLLVTCKTTYGAGTYSRRVSRSSVERILEDKRMVKNPVIVAREAAAQRKAEGAEAEARRKAEEEYQKAKEAEAIALEEIKKGPDKLVSTSGVAPFQLIEIKKKWSYLINPNADGIVFYPELSFSAENISDSTVASLGLKFIFWLDEKRIFDEVNQQIVSTLDSPLRPKVIGKRLFVRTNTAFKGNYEGFSNGRYTSPDLDMWVEIQYRLGLDPKWQPFVKFRLIMDGASVRPKL